MRRTAPVADAVGLLAGYALDRLLGDPRRWHPVAGFGRAAGALERRLYRPDRTAGAAFTALAVGGPVMLGAVAAAATRHRPVARAALVAAGTWAVLGGRTLRHEASVMGRTLRDGDLPAARQRLGHLCGRDPSTLGESELARATVESVAENTSDAVVAPLVWGAVAGLPGLLGYRAANTLDAMVGHRSQRYARFGTPAARLDDLLNLVPSRLTGLLTIAVAPVAHGDRERAWQVWRRDRNDHPSPNAGQCEAAMAGALGVRLGGRNVYFGRSEVRPFLGDGPRPEARHLKRAARISGAVGLAALGLAAAYPVTVGRVVNAVGRRALHTAVGGRGLGGAVGKRGLGAAISGRGLGDAVGGRGLGGAIGQSWSRAVVAGQGNGR
ncbi:adenosylcobinamide-phosphate synthase [Micromonospora profundi]|nr:cobalamin biosynthesis protein [Micromonospora profundi]NJC10479.1 adenosylcobinamide-phosphate synthase [Micromonospora profundi]